MYAHDCQLPCGFTKLSCVCVPDYPPSLPPLIPRDRTGVKTHSSSTARKLGPARVPTACVQRGAGRHRIAMSLPYRLRLRQSRCRNLAICSHGGRVLVGDNGCEGRSAPAGVTDSHSDASGLVDTTRPLENISAARGTRVRGMAVFRCKLETHTK